jgi:2-C-methyl-D-erythritol 4-phosphate cytidylyltransferase
VARWAPPAAPCAWCAGPSSVPHGFTEGAWGCPARHVEAIPKSAKDTNLTTTPQSARQTVAAVIPAAGRGVRLGPGTPKALRALGGVPILVHAVRALVRARTVGLVVVVAPADGVAEVRTLLDTHGLPESKEIRVVAGGETRQESVRLGLAALPEAVGTVLVHDAARPLVPVETVEAVAAAVCGGAPAVVPAMPLADTVKEVAPGPANSPEPVIGTPDRARLRAVQTPQGFRRDVLLDAHEKIAATGEGATDDAGMVERLGVPVVVIPGHEEAFKITRPIDLVLAEAVLARRRAGDVF